MRGKMEEGSKPLPEYIPAPLYTTMARGDGNVY